MRLQLLLSGLFALCMTSAAHAQDKLAASSGTDTAAARQAVLAPSAVDPNAAPQPATVQPRLAAQGQDTPAKKEEDHSNAPAAAPKKEQ